MYWILGRKGGVWQPIGRKDDQPSYNWKVYANKEVARIAAEGKNSKIVRN